MKRLWIVLIAVMIFGFVVLGWVGTRIYQEMPPIPDRVVTTDGQVLIAGGDIEKGQGVWQAMGGMEIGSIWGHGSYVAPDWTADWLHRECEFMLNDWSASQFGGPFDSAQPEQQGALRERLKQLIRSNTFDARTNTLTIDASLAKALEANQKYYADIFSNGRTGYAIPRGAQTDPVKLQQLGSFFFWTAWASAANRPGGSVSYTSNWPHEPLAGNIATGEAVVWTGVSMMMLVASIGGFVWYYAARPPVDPVEPAPATDPILKWKATASQAATLKFFVVVAALFLLQILTGAITAHYGVEGDGLYGIPLSRWLPYSITRTWHLQTGLFWIATSWLAAGLFIGPLISGKEPRGQRLGVNLLFFALLIVVAGSLAGEYLSVHHQMTEANSFYWGHQGWEYLDLGRVWQIALFAGLLLWLFLMLRVIIPALREKGEQRQLVLVFALSAGAIALFYGAGLMYGRNTHISMVE